MNRHETLRSQLLTLMAALVVMMALYGLRFNPLLVQPGELAVSSKMPTVNAYLISSDTQPTASLPFIWSSGTHKVYSIPTLAAGQRTIIQGVPWATAGGIKSPAYGFVSPSISLDF